MTILSIDHVQIAMPVGEEKEARDFYVGLLGFSEIPKPPELAKRGGAWFQSRSATPSGRGSGFQAGPQGASRLSGGRFGGVAGKGSTGRI